MSGKKQTSKKTASPAVPTPPPALYDKLKTVLGPLAGHAGELGDANDLKLHTTLDKRFAKRLNKSSDRVLTLARSLTELVGKDRQDLKKRKRLQEEDDVVHEFTSNVQDTIDGLLEATDSHLDIATGRKKAPVVTARPGAPATRPETRKIDTTGKPSLGSLASDILLADIPKPQESFTNKPNNSYDAPLWQPTLENKAHAMVPLDYVPTPATSRAGTPFFGETNSNDGNVPATGTTTPTMPDFSKHPYYHETKHLPYPSSLFDSTPAIPNRPFASTPFTYVDTPKVYEDMVIKLQASNELAVDLEYHATRSYTGFLCLMQISTREEDFVVDLLALRDLIREDKLGGVMVDPSIVKVFHGAESDILWLQQDFDIYVVGLFDTYHATKVLSFPQHSLAFLLQHYCDFTADKRYQMADWRIRPLPQEMLHYARSDTHFLLYVYDMLRNTLLDRAEGNQDQIRDVLKRSAETAMKLYQRPHYDDENGEGSGGWKGLIRNQLGQRGLLTKGPEYGRAGDMLAWGTTERGYMEERVFRKLHAWRDRTAREEDESLHFVLPSAVLWALTKRQPTTDTEFHNIVYAKNRLATSKKDEILQLVQEGRAEGVENHRIALAAILARDAEQQAKGDEDEGYRSDATVTAKKVIPAPLVRITNPSASLWDFGNAIASGSRSQLFGDAAGASLSDEDTRSALFGEALNRMPSALRDDPVVRTVMDGWSSKTSVKAGQIEAPVLPSDIEMAVPVATPFAPEQVPYVPAQARTTKPVPLAVKEEVVTVKKAKKRKADTTIPAVPEMTASPSDEPSPAKRAKATEKTKGKKKAVKAEDIPEFDYAQEPNQLDTFAPESSAKIKKAKKSKKPIVDTSSFRKPPTNPSELAAGNKSGNFKR